MAIKLPQGFEIQSRNAIDSRITLTLAEMLAINDNIMPDKYLAVCKDDGHLYLYDKTATPNSVSGKFTKQCSVVSSSDKNSVTVKSDGCLSVNEIGVEKLSDTEGVTLVLDGGCAPSPSES